MLKMTQIQAIQSSEDGKYYATIYGTKYEVILVSIPSEVSEKPIQEKVSTEVKGKKKGSKSVNG